MRLSKKETTFYVFVILSGFALLGAVIYVAITTKKEKTDSLTDSNKFL